MKGTPVTNPAQHPEPNQTTAPAPAADGKGADTKPTETKADALADQGFDMIILGGGLGALTAAYAATKQGLRPLILEERGRPGGLVCSGVFGGATVDIGAESYATRTPEVTDLCRELGLEPVPPVSDSWVWDHRRGAPVRIPFGTLGIPADLDDPVFVESLTAVAGPQAVARAREDLTLPPEVGADATNLADLVTARLGSAVLEAFVTPFAGGIHSTHPSGLDPRKVTPGLLEALAREGSLTGAVRATRDPKRPVVMMPRGGMFRLVDALVERILAAGGRIDNHVRALHLEAGIGQDNPRWVVWCKHTVSNRKIPGGPPEESGNAFGLATDRVVVALPANPALRILNSAAASMIRLRFHAERARRDASVRFDAGALEAIGDLTTGFELHPGTPVMNVTLAVNSPELDCTPHGSGMLVGPPPAGDPAALQAKAITHYSAKWPSTMVGAAPHTHVLRISYGREGDPKGFVYGITVERALADASRMLGVRLHESQILDSRRVFWGDAMTHPDLSERARIREIEAAAARVEGLDLEGAWVAGTGITAVVAHGLRFNQ
ncbi:protoporphyrinogen/coproporphyrinogen oxidase [Mobiluncus mulieris]|uniref:protoporphyrinogen/coproporphyrinogen oxidase n=1 Tax=Mobiluncus mulieris TaxID=2052 RepID=UPI0021E244C2|nr:FAD-dependent oxidoreductase [Mobiluncus mulieris]MCV0002005.1 NAD(P)-binding protein [Mobiluncus mulieris]